MNLRELGRRIRGRREKLGLKQADLSRALQISAQAVSKWERGDNAPDISMLLPLARILGVGTDWLLGDERSESTFAATVLVTSLNRFADRAAKLPPREVAAFANGILCTVTEAALAHDGVPVKYVGDGFLAFFSGAEHASRALAAARLARNSLENPDFVEVLNSGDIYLGSVGHPEYGSLDIIGRTVNTAFLVREWVAANGRTRLGVTAETADLLPDRSGFGDPVRIDVKGRDGVEVYEVE